MIGKYSENCSYNEEGVYPLPDQPCPPRLVALLITLFSDA